MRHIIIALGLAAFTFNINTYAGNNSVHAGVQKARDPGVNSRQHHQRHRVAQGVRSGELTAKEAKSLRAEQVAIRQKEREFKSDGTLTAQERVELHKDLNQSSKDIYVEKHDEERRGKTQAQ